MEKREHSPLPWRVGNPNGARIYSNKTPVGGCERVVRYENGKESTDNYEAWANAALIVESVNQHAALVEQRDRLVEALSQIRSEAESTHPDNLFAAWVVRECQAVLAAVEQGEGA